MGNMLCQSMVHRKCCGGTACAVGHRRSFSRKVTFLSEEVTVTDRALHSPVSVYLTPTTICYQVTQCFLPHIPDWSTGKGHNTRGGTEGRGGKDPCAPGGEHRPLDAEHHALATHCSQLTSFQRLFSVLSSRRMHVF